MLFIQTKYPSKLITQNLNILVFLFSLFIFSGIKAQEFAKIDSVAFNYLNKHISFHNNINSGYVKFEKKMANSSFNKGKDFTDTVIFYFYRLKDSTIYYWIKGRNFDFGNYSQGSFRIVTSKNQIIFKPTLKFPNLYFNGVLKDLVGYKPIVFLDSNSTNYYSDSSRWSFIFKKDTIKSNLLITDTKNTYIYIDTILCEYDVKMSMNGIEQWDREKILEISLNNFSLDSLERLLSMYISDSFQNFSVEYVNVELRKSIIIDTSARMKFITVSDYTGSIQKLKLSRKTVLVFGYNGCAPCKAWKKQIEELDTTFLKGLDIFYIQNSIIINKDKYSTYKADLKYCQDVFSVSSYPTTVILDGDGKIVNVIRGYSYLNTKHEFLGSIK
jgi:thioredoxin-related protein